MIKKYITKPCEIVAVEWNDDNFEEISEFTNYDAEMVLVTSGKHELVINTLKGQVIVNVGDFIIKGLRGEFYPCKPDVFHKKYEEQQEEITNVNVC